MSTQQHMILRQVFELHGCSEEDAPRLQAQMRGAFYRHFLPMIERVCSEHSLPGRIARIDTLEIDVGALDWPEIDDAATARFASAFAGELTAAIDAGPHIDSDLELVCYFLVAGTLPWWADASDRAAFEASLARLAERAPHALRQALAASTDSERALCRLARACPPALVEQLVAAWVPAADTLYSGWSRDLIAAIQALPSARGHAPRTLGLIAREEVLRAASVAGMAMGNVRQLVEAVFARIAHRLGVRVGELCSGLRAYAEDGARTELAWLRQFAAGFPQGAADEVADDVTDAPQRQRESDQRLFQAELAQDAAEHSTDASQRRSEIGAKALTQFFDDLARLAPSPLTGTELRQRLRALLDRLPGRLQTVASSMLGGDAMPSIEKSVTVPSSTEALAALLGVALEDGLLTPEILERSAAPAARSPPGSDEDGPGIDTFAPTVLRMARERVQAPGRPAIAERKRAAPEAAPAEVAASGKAAAQHKQAVPGTGFADARAGNDSATRHSVSDDKLREFSLFSDSEHIYVENSGLVILWPFLGSFFARLDLIEDKRFKDEAARQRAVGLLQFIAGADEDPQEYLLPLNKVLCGMKPEEVFNFGPEITAKEIEECNDLLAAVIQQATILREMSNDGFRGSFLLRKGQLGARDGNWLLRVERETHDVVLDRFPWSVQFVKLPWMEAMLQVEW